MTPPGQHQIRARFGGRRVSAYRPWLLAGLLLAGLDWFVGHVFVPTHVTPVVAPARRVIRDRTAGQNLGIVFRMSEEPLSGAGPNVVMVGDSTVMTSFRAESTSLTPNVQRRMSEVRVVEFAAAGLPASHASVMIAKALGLGADLVTYAMTPRIVCEPPLWATDAHDWIADPDVIRELGLEYVAENFGITDVARSFVTARSNLLRFRRELRTWVDRLRHRLPQAFHPRTQPSAYAPLQFGPPRKLSRPYWTRKRCVFDDSNAEVRALRRIFEMCGASGRCLLYHGPINPVGSRMFEAGVMAEFAMLTRGLATEHGVPFRSYANAIGPREFIVPKTPRGEPIIDAVHLNARGRLRLAALIANDASRLLTTRMAATAHEPVAHVARGTTGG